MAVKQEEVKIFNGKRKSAVARVRVKYGDGKVIINGKEAKEYFSFRESLMYIVNQPFLLTSNENKYDVYANICGGGVAAQAEALRHGISKFLLDLDEENRAALKKNGLLTRDPREVERKKYGRRGARRSFQFSKR